MITLCILMLITGLGLASLFMLTIEGMLLYMMTCGQWTMAYLSLMVWHDRSGYILVITGAMVGLMALALLPLRGHEA